MKKLKSKSAAWIIALTLFSFTTSAQQIYEITVKDAVNIAFKNVADINNAKMDYKIAESRNKEITGMAYPQISASLQG
ncbi:MAG: hypothetical protein ACHQFX_11320, partial [Chitinophagales bacterium]